MWVRESLKWDWILTKLQIESGGSLGLKIVEIENTDL
jgi:hypothetical protein